MGIEGRSGDVGGKAWARDQVALLLLVVAVAVAQMPLAGVLRLHHHDERYYTDAALVMLETGDYATPRFYDGRPRPHKPPLTYWTIAASYRALGVGPLSARLPAILAGVAMLLASHALAKAFTGRADVALLATAMVATQFTFLQCANRCTPDIWLCAGLAIGFAGLARLLMRRPGEAASLCLLLAGSAIAVLAKGLLGVVFFVFSAVMIGRSAGGRRRWHRPALALWIALIGAWFASMAWKHGLGFLGGFLYDQIVGRLIKDAWWRKPLHVVGYAALTPLLFLPWLPVVAAHPSARRRLLAQMPRPATPLHRVALGWALVCCLIFGMGNKITPRFILSVVPLLAAVLAEALLGPSESAGCGGPMRGGSLTRGMVWTGFGLWMLALIAIPLTGGIAAGQTLPLLVLAATMALAWGVVRTAPRPVAAMAGWACLALSALPMIALVCHVPFNHGADRVVDRAVFALQFDPKTRGRVVCSLHGSALARARIHAGRSLPVIPAKELGTNAIPAAVNARIVSEYDRHTPQSDDFKTAGKIRMPASSSREAMAAWRAAGVPPGARLLSYLREGMPPVDYRIEVRTPRRGDDAPGRLPAIGQPAEFRPVPFSPKAD